MRWIFLFVVCGLVSGVQAQCNLYGLPGTGNNPSAYLLPDGHVSFGFRNIASEHIPYAPGHDNSGFYAAMGFLPFMDIRIAFIRPRNVYYHGSGDRTYSVRFRLLKESPKRPQITIGFRDPVGGSGVDEQRGSGRKLSASYIVATKHIDIKFLRSTEFHLGYGTPWPSEARDSKFDFLIGPFGGVQFQPLPLTTLFVEYDAVFVNAGAKVSYRFLQAFAMMADLKYLSLGMGVQFGI
jgi:hypothetical protein